MHEILRSLPGDARVLDLGSGSGSFSSTGLRVTRVDIDPGGDLRADAARLPFRDRTFDAVISNHSLEHIVDLDDALGEIGRVLRSQGALYVAVPDAGTLCDRIYRWAASGGGHVNPFRSASEFARRVTSRTGLPWRATRTLHTSLSYLNRHNVPGGWAGWRWAVLGCGSESLLKSWSLIARMLDRRLGTRLSVYGWAFFFGEIAGRIDTAAWTNVCVRCGAGHSDETLVVRRRSWSCPQCGANNFFTPSVSAS